MSKHSFLASPEWRKIEHLLVEQIEEHREAALMATGFDDKEYERGWVDSLRSFMALPEAVLKEEGDEENGQETYENEEKEQEEKGVISLATRPRRTEFFRG